MGRTLPHSAVGQVFHVEHGALARDRTSVLQVIILDTLPLSYERVPREKGLQDSPIHGLDPDRHGLPGVRGVGLYFHMVRQPRLCKPCGKRTKLGLVFYSQGYRISSRREIAG